MNLYEISQALEEVVEALLDADESEVETLMEDLDLLVDARDEKIANYCHVIRNAEASAKALKAEALMFAERAKAQENLAARLKDALLAELQESGEVSVTAGQWKIRRQKSPLQVVVDVDVYELPAEFTKVSETPDKSALKEALIAEVPVEGARLERGEHLRISLA